jgi:dihydroorotate dehydrogenase
MDWANKPREGRFLQNIFHSLLLKLPPEVAHRVGMCALRGSQWIARFFRRQTFCSGRVIFLKAAPTLALRGRVGLAAGFDKNAEAYSALVGMGFGFVEVGTVTPEPQPGNPKPRIFRTPGEGLINHLGFNSKGLAVFTQNLARYRTVVPRGCVLANIGKNKNTPDTQALDDYRKCFRQLVGKVDGFVVNLSSPNTPGLRSLQTKAFLDEIAGIVPAKVPVFIKFAPDLSDAELESLCAVVREHSEFCGAVVTNTSRAIAEETFRREQGGYSGPLLFSRSLQCVRIARRALGDEKILIGVGGVNSVERAEQMRAAGADLVEIYTSFIYKGPELVRALQNVR